MRTTNFKLVLNESGPTVFPVPANDQYQWILDLKIEGEVEWLELDAGGRLAVVPNGKAGILFQHVPQVINQDIRRLRVKRLSLNQLPAPDLYMDYQDPILVELAKKWLGSNRELAPNQVVRLFYERTLEFLTYGQPIKGLYTYRDAFNKRVTDCGGFATFLGTLLLTQGIKVRLVVGQMYKIGLRHQLSRFLTQPQDLDDVAMHAWLEVLLVDGNWLPLDPSIEWKRIRGQTKRQGGCGYIPADRLVLSYGQNHHFKYLGKNYRQPIFQHPTSIAL